MSRRRLATLPLLLIEFVAISVLFHQATAFGLRHGEARAVAQCRR